MTNWLIGKRPILKFGKSEITGRTFIKEEIELPELICPVYLDHPDTPNLPLDKMAGVVEDIEVREDGIYGRIRVLDTPQGKILGHLEDYVEFLAGGVGELTVDYSVKNYRLTHVAAVAKETR